MIISFLCDRLLFAAVSHRFLCRKTFNLWGLKVSFFFLFVCLFCPQERRSSAWWGVCGWSKTCFWAGPAHEWQWGVQVCGQEQRGNSQGRLHTDSIRLVQEASASVVNQETCLGFKLKLSHFLVFIWSNCVSLLPPSDASPPQSVNNYSLSSPSSFQRRLNTRTTPPTITCCWSSSEPRPELWSWCWWSWCCWWTATIGTGTRSWRWSSTREREWSRDSNVCLL